MSTRIGLKDSATYHLSSNVSRHRCLGFLMHSREKVHGERKECLQIPLDGVGEVPELFCTPLNARNISICRDKICRLYDLGDMIAF